MKVGDFITYEDVMALTVDEWQSFRAYLRLLGHRVSEAYGQQLFSVRQICSVFLHPDGDLGWRENELPYAKGVRITLEEVKRMAHLGMMA